MRSFGISAPSPVVQRHFGFDVDHVLAAARQQLALHAAAAG
jgi:transketolase